ncbi:MAG: FAD:protein FMN transferase [Myxococcales bacterium]|nr:FAD:protein FMN transferase [Myxococcales bacterium]
MVRRDRWQKLLLVLLVTGGLLSCSPPTAPSATVTPNETISEQRELLGTYVQIQVAGLPETSAREAIAAGFQAIEQLQADAHPELPSSDIFRLNQNAGQAPVKIHEDIFDIISLAREISEHSQGAFDVTFVGIGRLYNLRHPENFRIPNDEELRQALQRVDYRQLQLDPANHTAYLTRTDMAVDLGGIAKGWSTDSAMAALKARGVKNAIVNAGGDMMVSGSKNGEPWRIGIQHPRRGRDDYFAVIKASGDLAIVTSGDYERYVMHDGVRYHHIMDPHTGRPASLSQSVTIIAPNGVLADGLATAVFVLGPEAGLAMLAQYYPQCDALIIDRDGKRHDSPNLTKRHTVINVAEKH